MRHPQARGPNANLQNACAWMTKPKESLWSLWYPGSLRSLCKKYLSSKKEFKIARIRWYYHCHLSGNRHLTRVQLLESGCLEFCKCVHKDAHNVKMFPIGVLVRFDGANSLLSWSQHAGYLSTKNPSDLPWASCRPIRFNLINGHSVGCFCGAVVAQWDLLRELWKVWQVTVGKTHFCWLVSTVDTQVAVSKVS